MTNKEILQIALQQSAIDSNCDAADFLSEKANCLFQRKMKRQENTLNCRFSVILLPMETIL